jgi:hypothetical protein
MRNSKFDPGVRQDKRGFGHSTSVNAVSIARSTDLPDDAGSQSMLMLGAAYCYNYEGLVILKKRSDPGDLFR